MGVRVPVRGTPACVDVCTHRVAWLPVLDVGSSRVPLAGESFSRVEEETEVGQYDY